MASDSRPKAHEEAILYLEGQVRSLREDQVKSHALIEQLQRQMADLYEMADDSKRSVREVDAKFVPFRGLPEKLRALDEGTEHIRQDIASSRAEVDSALRILQSEADYDRQERSEVFKRIESAASQLMLVAADVAQMQGQVSNVGQVMQTLIERQREVEARVEQFGLRLDRAIEVNRDVEQRIKTTLEEDQAARFEVVYERMQVVGEMIRRNEELIKEATAEQTLRQEVLQEIAIWRDQHNRIDGRLAVLEEAGDGVLSAIDRLRSELTLVEGRHSGLSERVAAMRRDISEVVDAVRDEFQKFNQMIEKQRRKQIQVLEQELRELKFHAFRPPEEP